MKDFDGIIKSKKSLLKAIGIFEIIGGVIGLYSILSELVGGLQLNLSISIIVLFVVAFYSLSVYAGIRLFSKTEKGILYSQIVQYLQIFAVSFGGVTYFLASGAFLNLGYNMTLNNVGFNFSLFSEFQIHIANSNQESYVYINLLAIILLNLIERSKKIIEVETERKENYWKNITG